MDGVNTWGLWGLLLSAFLSSTLLPGSSEAMLLALAHHSPESKLTLMGVATLGNTLGGMSSWLLGWLLSRRKHASAMESDKRSMALARLQRWGSPILLLSWVPVIGDPLCLAAGWLRISAWLALLFIAVGKGARYTVLLLLV